jgi:peptide/nickel transport system substrate-binding protein
MRFVWVAVAMMMISTATGAQTLRVGLNNDPDVLDPSLSRTYVGTVVFTAICDKLVDLNEKLEIVPMLAQSWEWTDPKTVVFHLRPDLTFEDGTKLDAAAVKYSLERHLNMEGSFRHPEINALDHVEVVDPVTVRAVLKQPSSPFVATLTDRSGMLVSPKAAEVEGKDFGLHPVCAGPFSFTERVAQDHITLDRFSGYWNAEAIHFDRVIYRVVSDSSVRLANLQAGAVDLSDVVPTDVDTVKKNPKLKLESSPGLGYTGITINVAGTTPLGHDARVRHAFELAIDRQALIEVVFNGLYTPNAQGVAPANPLHVDTVKPPARDVEKAKSLLAAAGVALPVHVTLMIANNPQSGQVAEVVQSMVKEAGFDVRINSMDFGTSISMAQAGNFEAYYIGWSGLLDADSNLWSFLHTGGALNLARYSNPGVDDLLDRARLTTDAVQRRALYAEMWQQERADLPLIYLWTPRYIFGMTTKLQNYHVLPDGLIRLQGVRMQQ